MPLSEEEETETTTVELPDTAAEAEDYGVSDLFQKEPETEDYGISELFDKPTSTVDPIESHRSDTESRTNYEDTPQETKDLEQEGEDEQKASIQKEQQDKIEGNDPNNLYDTTLDTLKHLGYGIPKMVEETGQTVGLLDDNAWNIPEPENTRQALAQGFTQALSFFLPASLVTNAAVKAIPVGARLTALFRTSARLRRARNILASYTAGAGTDAIAFDFKDPNAANFLMMVTGISDDSTAGVLLYKYLATKPENWINPETGQEEPDPEWIARTKSMTSGGVAGAIIGAIFRRMGLSYEKYKESKRLKEEGEDVTPKILKEELGRIGEIFEKETGVSIKDLQFAVDEYVDEVVDLMKESYTKASPQEQKAILDGLPKNLDTAVVHEIEKKLTDPISKFSRVINEPNPKLVEFLGKVADGVDIEPEDLFYIDKKGKKIPIIESFNLNKLLTSPEIKSQIQALSRIIDTKSLKRRSFDDNIEDLVNLLGQPKEEIINILGQNVGNLEKAVGYVPAYKVMVKLALDHSHNAFTKLKSAKSGTDDFARLKREAKASAANLEELLQLASRESHLASRLLSAHKSSVDVKALTHKVGQKVFSELVDSSDQAEIKYAATIDNLNNISKKRVEDFKESQGIDIKVKTPGVASRTVKVDPKLTKKARKAQSKIDATEARIKRLEKRLADLKAGKSIPKKIKREKSTRELELEDLIEEELAKTRLPKEQLALRKKHEQLTNKIKKLKEGKVTSAGFKELKTTEISELQAELKKVQKKLKKPKTDTEKSAAEVKRLKAELDKLILTKRGTPKPVKTPRERLALEKELMEEIQNQKKRLGWQKKGNKITLEDLRELALEEAAKKDIQAIHDATLTQLRMRLKANRWSTWQKFKGIVQEIYINGLLSSFKTAEVNGIGNNYALGMTPIERFMASTKGGGPITQKEAAIFAYKTMTSIPDGFKAFRRAWNYGPEDPNIKMDFQKPYERVFSKEMLKAGGWVGEAIDFIGNVVNFPGKTVLTMDQGYKAVTYLAEKEALSYRKAVSEFMEAHGGRKPSTVQELAETELRKKEIVDNVDLHPEIHQEASDLSHKNTYTNPLADVEEIDAMGKKRVVPGLAKMLQKAIERDPSGILRTYLPFYQTPINLMKYSWERMPGVNLFHSQLQRELNPELSSPAVVQAAKGRVATGKYILFGALGLATNGNITNGPPSDPILRKRMETAMGGPHWYSANIGFGYFPYNRLDPIGIVFATASMLNEFRKSLTSLNSQATYDEEGKPLGDDRLLYDKYEELTSMAVINLTRLIKDRNYLQGVSDVMGIWSDDIHEKKKFWRRLQSVDPRISFYSSFRRNLTQGIEATRHLRSQPPIAELDPEREMGDETPFEKSVKTTNEQIALEFDDALKKLIPGFGEKRVAKNLMGEVQFYPGTHFEDIQHKTPLEYVKNMTTSLFHIGATNLGKADSQSAVIRKLAELESKMEAPSQVSTISFSIGVNEQTQRSMGMVVLTDEQKEFYINEWIKLNTDGYLESLARSKEFQKPADMSWKEFVAKGGTPATEQLADLERVLKMNRLAAKNETISHFENLEKRMDYLREISNEGTDKPNLPTLGIMDNYDLSTLQPLEQGQQ